ncbi:MAG: carboxy-S-adenosyl-L-methionine synthase CmoA [Bacteriovoracaceae bacterium]|nr:carboxy-S-adenosyl-L-methionine synthase CmoA [Bacteriovoracaceae bacterium]
MGKDQVFKKKQEQVLPFEFNEDVAMVFDDMVSRSVPFYNEVHSILLDILDRTYSGKGPIVDLGCSTATTICLIDKHLKNKDFMPSFIGVDNSESMVKKAQEKLEKEGVRSAEIKCMNISDFRIPDSEVVVMNYTLQFIPKDKRPDVLSKVYNALQDGGTFLLAEKIISTEPEINDLMIELYYDFKRRNGYSELEISQKREALENVLVPLTPKEQINNLKSAGFEKVEMLFRWYNFCCYLCKK